MRERFVAVDGGLLERTLAAADADRTTTVRFELFPDAVVELTTASFTPRADGFTWTGAGVGPDGWDQEATLAYQRPAPEALAAGAIPAVVGNFWAHGSQYRLQAASRTGVYSIAELDQAAVAASEGGHDDVAADDDGHDEPTSETASQPDAIPSAPLPPSLTTAQGTGDTAASGGWSNIDVLVVHTQAALAARPEIQAELAAQLEAGNRANDTSGVRFRFRTAHFMQVQWSENANNMTYDLRRLEDGTIPGVHQARDAYAGDLVIMAGAGYTDYCGLASTIGASASTAFAVVNADPNCVLTAVHEFGHLLGLRHDWRVDSTAGYNHGFVNTVARFRTIMAYNHPDCDPAGCTRIEHWSDPDRQWNGQQTGVPSGQPNPADNGRALAERYLPAVTFRNPPSRPVGAYDSLTQAGGGTRVSGWAIDFDTPATPIYVDFHINGTRYGRYLASKPRPDLEDYYPNAGSAHGFNEILMLNDGDYTVCVYAVDSDGSGAFTGLGCKSITVKTNPFGSFDGVLRVPGGARVYGWAIDPDMGTGPTTVTAYVTGDSTPTTGTANGYRPDVTQFGYGPNHGFSVMVKTTSGTREFCVWADNVGPGSSQRLACRTATLAADPYGAINTVTRAPGGARLVGWAIDPDTADPIAVRFLVDGVPVAADIANRSRPDVAAANPYYGPNHGYSTVVPMTSGAAHQVCVVGINVDSGADATLGCTTFHPDPHPFGYVDGSARPEDVLIQMSGWVIDWDTAAPIAVRATVDGVAVAPAAAAETRTDVGSVYPEYGPNHGYTLRIPVTPGPHRVCVTAVNVGPGADRLLGCRDFGATSSPFGTIDHASRPQSVLVAMGGWAIDGDTTDPIPVRATVDGVVTEATLAAEERSDVGAAYPAYGPNHGYFMRIPVTPGPHTVCITAVNTASGADTTIGCRTL